ncbi:MAG TPA: phosphopyruvate hydratase [Bryobacterales bacterium]|nr:phosphopyruvate hydratase [Bryobacterales bacterium]
MKLAIQRLSALEILDSRGRPTVAVEAELSNSVAAWAQVPSGASTGRHEALEIRDNDPARYAGKGVRRAVENVEKVLAPVLAGMDAEDQQSIDQRMIELDGTANKSRLGANAILGVSCAVARAVATARNLPLWQSLQGERDANLPVPMVNILSGGLHAGGNIEFQDFLAIPHGFDTFSEALEALTAIHRAAFDLIQQKGCRLTGVADEGGWGPYFETNEQALEILMQAIGEAGYRPAEQVSIAIDVASSHFYRDGQYQLKTENRLLSTEEMIELLDSWSRRYPVLSIEDGLQEDDWDGWVRLNRRLGARLQVLGDDLFATNPERLENGIRLGAANAVLVKMNQIGTLTETFRVIDRAREAGLLAVISTRSGETEDSFLADLAVASGSGQIKPGSVTRSERLSKFNRLLEIEARSKLAYQGSAVFRRIFPPSSHPVSHKGRLA